jgi:hypothetical protein
VAKPRQAHKQSIQFIVIITLAGYTKNYRTLERVTSGQDEGRLHSGGNVWGGFGKNSRGLPK